MASRALWILLLVAACGGRDPGPTGEFTPVIWSETADVQTRASDLGRCELSIVGADLSMDQGVIIDRSRNIAGDERIRRLASCLKGRGYIVSEGRICTPEDLAQGRLQRKPLTDQLPPLAIVQCHDPATDGFIVKT